MLRDRAYQVWTPQYPVSFNLYKNFVGAAPPYPAALQVNYTVPGYSHSFERIIDDDASRRSQWNNVQHYKRWVEVPEYQMGFPWGTYTSAGNNTVYDSGGLDGVDPLLAYDSPTLVAQFGSFGDHARKSNGAAMYTHQATNSGLNIIADPPLLSQMISQSLITMLPSAKADLSLINSLIELKDFKSLPESLIGLKNLVTSLVPSKGPRKSVSKLMRGIRGTFSPSDGPTFQQVLRTAADGYLQTQFNILPLLQDISGLYTALSRTERRINDLIVRQGKRQFKRFYVDVPLTPFGTVGGVDADIQNASLNQGQFSGTWTSVLPPGYIGPYKQHVLGITFQRESRVTTQTFRAQMEYNFHYTRFQVEHAQILGLLDTIGVNLNPAIIWNAIPFSFLIDWVVGVSRWLSNRKVLNMEPVINITKYLWSWKVVRTTRLLYRSYQKNPKTPTIFSTFLPDLHETIYRRQVGIPSSYSIITSGINSKELTLGLALAITRKRRQKQRGS